MWKFRNFTSLIDVVCHRYVAPKHATPVLNQAIPSPNESHPATIAMPECSRPWFSWWTATAGSDVDQSVRPIFDDFFQHLWPYIGNNTANVVFQMVKRLWLILIDQ
ncbi:hypothetical protein TNCV_4285311 [Trichonephila clavipes]|nr:hypothetical protein TNCV_4285311 [Trichonephila clavipes]